MKLGPVRRAATAACALPLLLAGCTEAEPTPEMPDPTTSTPTATETESGPVEPTLPPEAEGDGVEAAEAFVSHFYATVDYAQAIGDAEPIRQLSVSTCKSCRGGAEIIDRIYRQGGSITGGEHSVERAKVTGKRSIPDEGSIYYLIVRVSHTDQRVEGSKDLDGQYGAGAENLRYQIVYSDAGWQVLEWNAV